MCRTGVSTEREDSKVLNWVGLAFEHYRHRIALICKCQEKVVRSFVGSLAQYKSRSTLSLLLNHLTRFTCALTSLRRSTNRIAPTLWDTFSSHRADCNAPLYSFRHCIALCCTHNLPARTVDLKSNVFPCFSRVWPVYFQPITCIHLQSEIKARCIHRRLLFPTTAIECVAAALPVAVLKHA